MDDHEVPSGWELAPTLVAAGADVGLARPVAAVVPATTTSAAACAG